MLPRKINAEATVTSRGVFPEGRGLYGGPGRRREGREVEWLESELLKKGEMHCGTGKPDHLSEL